MTEETKNALAPVVNQPRRPPVRVKLRRVNANLAKVYPPDGGKQSVVEAAEEGPGHGIRLRQCLTVAVAGCRSVALRRDFGNRH
jgi:hypothetical protein